MYQKNTCSLTENVNKTYIAILTINYNYICAQQFDLYVIVLEFVYSPGNYKNNKKNKNYVSIIQIYTQQYQVYIQKSISFKPVARGSLWYFSFANIVNGQSLSNRISFFFNFAVQSGLLRILICLVSIFDL
jgi:hypothetical protein